MTQNDSRPPAGADAPDAPTRHTAIGVVLNLLLLAMIGYGYWQSTEWGWAWAVVALPIVVVTARYIGHLRRR